MKKIRKMKNKLFKNGEVLALSSLKSKKGMELVQVGILIAIAVGIGLIFKEQISAFINNTFSSLLGSSFN